jgi:hypothetical protein
MARVEVVRCPKDGNAATSPDTTGRSARRRWSGRRNNRINTAFWGMYRTGFTLTMVDGRRVVCGGRPEGWAASRLLRSIGGRGQRGPQSGY